jgi:hypothetical protein
MHYIDYYRKEVNSFMQSTSYLLEILTQYIHYQLNNQLSKLRKTSMKNEKLITLKIMKPKRRTGMMQILPTWSRNRSNLSLE